MASSASQNHQRSLTNDLERLEDHSPSNQNARSESPLSLITSDAPTVPLSDEDIQSDRDIEMSDAALPIASGSNLAVFSHLNNSRRRASDRSSALSDLEDDVPNGKVEMDQDDSLSDLSAEIDLSKLGSPRWSPNRRTGPPKSRGKPSKLPPSRTARKRSIAPVAPASKSAESRSKRLKRQDRARDDEDDEPIVDNMVAASTSQSRSTSPVVQVEAPAIEDQLDHSRPQVAVGSPIDLPSSSNSISSGFENLLDELDDPNSASSIYARQMDNDWFKAVPQPADAPLSISPPLRVNLDSPALASPPNSSVPLGSPPLSAKPQQSVKAKIQGVPSRTQSNSSAEQEVRRASTSRSDPDPEVQIETSVLDPQPDQEPTDVMAEENEAETDVPNFNHADDEEEAVEEDEEGIEDEFEEEIDDASTKERNKAIEALFKIEIEFAKLRDKLYLERMQEVAREKQSLESNTHPELLYLNTVVEQRRTVRLKMAKDWLQQLEVQYDREHAAEERAIWSDWGNKRGTSKTDLLESINKKRRLLEREKRVADRARDDRLGSFLSGHANRRAFQYQLSMANQPARDQELANEFRRQQVPVPPSRRASRLDSQSIAIDIELMSVTARPTAPKIQAPASHLSTAVRSAQDNTFKAVPANAVASTSANTLSTTTLAPTLALDRPAQASPSIITSIPTVVPHTSTTPKSNMYDIANKGLLTRPRSASPPSARQPHQLFGKSDVVSRTADDSQVGASTGWPQTTLVSTFTSKDGQKGSLADNVQLPAWQSMARPTPIQATE